MSYEQASQDPYRGERSFARINPDDYDFGDGDGRDERRRHDEVFSRRVPAGKRTYFFDVKTTRAGDDFFLTITESKRVDEGRYEKHKIFLYKEDFGKFLSAMHEAVARIRDDYLPDYAFEPLPDFQAPGPPEGAADPTLAEAPARP